jgi:hypothetical protein
MTDDCLRCGRATEVLGDGTDLSRVAFACPRCYSVEAYCSSCWRAVEANPRLMLCQDCERSRPTWFLPIFYLIVPRGDLVYLLP